MEGYTGCISITRCVRSRGKLLGEQEQIHSQPSGGLARSRDRATGGLVGENLHIRRWANAPTRGSRRKDMDDSLFASATELATWVRQCQVSASELVDAYLARIARYNPSLNAIVTLDEERARRRAREADTTLARDERWGPLHGVPMTLKDGHSVSGMRTTAGFEPLSDYLPREDGTVAARLKAAGVIIVGKTN